MGLRHGNADGGPGNLDAHIEESRIYGSVLNQDEIKNLKEGTLPVKVQGRLTTVWAMVKMK